ncbi:unnamed protein product [Pleuronectes platessa]|uniref:Uncharacterized protein n=1 Tax=Pleuronectes platessa TaxID=8262 RepID=A0A9N7V8L2_PLEPL|nr:unnamed protein product [Pleuronectes platessa]
MTVHFVLREAPPPPPESDPRSLQRQDTVHQKGVRSLPPSTPPPLHPYTAASRAADLWATATHSLRRMCRDRAANEKHSQQHEKAQNIPVSGGTWKQGREREGWLAGLRDSPLHVEGFAVRWKDEERRAAETLPRRSELQTCVSRCLLLLPGSPAPMVTAIGSRSCKPFSHNVSVSSAEHEPESNTCMEPSPGLEKDGARAPVPKNLLCKSLPTYLSPRASLTRGPATATQPNENIRETLRRKRKEEVEEGETKPLTGFTPRC